MMNKKIILISILTIFVILTACSQQEPTADKPPQPQQQDSQNQQDLPQNPTETTNDPLASAQQCNRNSDCVPEPKKVPQCAHYCIGDECEGVRLCNALNKNIEFRLQCIWSEPCQRPTSVKCINNLCVTG